MLRLVTQIRAVRRSATMLRPGCRRGLCDSGSAGKEARLKRAQAAGQGAAPAAGTAKLSSRGVGAVAGCFLLGYAIIDTRNNKDGVLGKLYWGSQLQKWMSSFYEWVWGSVEEVFLPSSDALLPEWPTDPYYAAIPPGTPVPPLLVLDLEKTLIASEYDARYGWRHVKRPGLDKFIQQMQPYYEIVIFCESDVVTLTEVLNAIDTTGQCFKLGPNAAEIRDNVMLKRLDYMNRDIRRIVLIDDDEKASSLFSRNTLIVKPYVDVYDKSDTELLDLVPLLQALVHEQIEDYRDTFDSLGTHEASEAVTEYKMRLSKKKNYEEGRRNKGLGGLARSLMLQNSSMNTPAEPRESSVLSAADIVGSSDFDNMGDDVINKQSVPVVELEFNGKIKTEIGSSAKPQKGKLLQFLEQKEKETQEMEMLKREKMNEIYMKRMSGN